MQHITEPKYTRIHENGLSFGMFECLVNGEPKVIYGFNMKECMKCLYDELMSNEVSKEVH